MREENARTSANMVDSVQSGGVRSVMGALPRLVGMNNDMNKEGRAYLDGQVQQRDYAIAQDDTRLRQMEEQRYQGEIAGLGNAMGVGSQNAWSGMRGIMSSLAYGADNGLFNKEPKDGNSPPAEDSRYSYDTKYDGKGGWERVGTLKG
jgi:hypothetical protein